MTAYANLRDTLAAMHRANYFAAHSDVSTDLIERFTYALYDLEDALFAACKTSKDYDSVYTRYDNAIERAANTASGHDAKFVAAVMRDAHMW